MTTTATVQQPPAVRDPRAATLQNVTDLINSGAPWPFMMHVDRDGYLSLHFDDAAAARVWVGTMALEETPNAVASITVRACTSFLGDYRDRPVSLYLHQAAEVEPYVGEPKLAAWITAADPSDYFREDAETGAPLPDGVEGHALGSRSTCLAEAAE